MPTTTSPRKAADRPADRKRKMTFYLSDDERRRFLAMRGAGGHTENSAFIVAALDLDADTAPQTRAEVAE